MDMLAIVVPVFAVIATGLIAVRTGLVPASIASGLVTFSYFVCVPSLMFSIVARYPLDGLLAWDFWLLFGAGSLLALFVLRYAGGRLLGPDGRTRTVSALAAVMANTGFVALPVLYAIFGEAGVPSAAIANIVIAAVLIPAGVVLLEATGGIGGGVRATPRRMALQVLKNPMVWPALLGFAFAAFRLPVPQMIEDYLDLLGQGLTPCALFAIGASVNLATLRHEGSRILVVSIVKLVALPALVLGCGMALGLDPFLTACAVIASASPTANTAHVLAVQYRAQEQAVAATISATTAASVLTLPAWLFLLGLLEPGLFGG
ncbi:MAG: AEC family transporter [Proteobacteria bacterium]|nr:AEC family transporter [Pseudomonadota bacterium]MDA0951331.1 AEC family transporter [Pseudomonadota bacterium]